MTTKRVLSVGQCAADHHSIAVTLRRTFGAEVVGADTATEALEALRNNPFALVLVNRVFDADGGSGLDLIRALKADDKLKTAPVMLVSNFADAQKQATAAGAEPGFGKASLGQAPMLERVELYLRAE